MDATRDSFVVNCDQHRDVCVAELSVLIFVKSGDEPQPGRISCPTTMASFVGRGGRRTIDPFQFGAGDAEDLGGLALRAS
jgi:hypothetical protein